MKYRKIKARVIEDEVKDLCIRANVKIRPDVKKALKNSCQMEKKGSVTRELLQILLENADLAAKNNIPLCQDTGVVSVFVKIGEEVIVEDGNITRAINNGVRKAYKEGFFRKSVVDDPITRKNTGTNTPAVVHIDVVKGNKIKLFVMPKGFGCENKSRIIMLNPTTEEKEIIKFCVDVVKQAGPDACPPYVVGVGIGGTMELSAHLAKKALLRPVGKNNPKAHIASLEKKITKEINNLNIGVMGLSGKTTVLGVNILEAPTHIAGLPVSVNVSCHALRSACSVI